MPITDLLLLDEGMSGRAMVMTRVDMDCLVVDSELRLHELGRGLLDGEIRMPSCEIMVEARGTECLEIGYSYKTKFCVIKASHTSYEEGGW